MRMNDTHNYPTKHAERQRKLGPTLTLFQYDGRINVQSVQYLRQRKHSKPKLLFCEKDDRPRPAYTPEIRSVLLDL